MHLFCMCLSIRARQEYRDTAWVFAGNLPNNLTEGDVLAVMSQYGEVEDFRLVRDEGTGKSKGFAFVKYEDWRSAVLTVDNFNGMALLGRTLRVDHARYKPPAKKAEEEAAESMEDKARRYQPGHAYDGQDIALTGYDLHQGQNLFARGGRGGGAAAGGAGQAPASDWRARGAGAGASAGGIADGGGDGGGGGDGSHGRKRKRSHKKKKEKRRRKEKKKHGKKKKKKKHRKGERRRRKGDDEEKSS